MLRGSMVLFYATLILSVILQHGANGIWFLSGSTVTPNETNFDDIIALCSKCKCYSTMSPLPIDCSQLQLTDLKDVDWSIQNGSDINTKKINITFEGHRLTDVPAFPEHLPIMSLDLKGNIIFQIADYAFGALDDLVYLDLSENKLDSGSLREPAFQRNASLEALPLKELILSSNEIGNIHKDAFDHLTNLKILRLDGNPLKGINEHTSHALAALRNLEVLDLSHTELQTLPSDFSSILKSVTDLNLSDNEFTSVPESLWFTQTLNSLIFDKNHLRFLDDTTFPTKLKVRNLSLSFMPDLIDIRGGTFGNMYDLKRIDIKHNLELISINKNAFRQGDSNASAYNLSELKQISLHGNSLTTLDQTMLPWRSMEWVDIQNNLWNCDCKITWMIHELVTIIEFENVELVENLLCFNPEELRDKKLVDLVAETLTCAPPVDQGSTTSSEQGQDNYFIHSEHAGMSMVWIVILVAVVTSILVSVLVLLVSRRCSWFKGDTIKPTVYYRRQLDETDQNA